MLTLPHNWALLGGGGPPVPDPDLDFDFVNGVYRQGATSGSTLSGFITTSRASVGYADDLAGNWTSFANNVARRTNKGLLVEEARTNSIRNNSMQGAVAGSPGTLPTNWPAITNIGVTQTVVGVGTQNGVDYIDIRRNGTVSGASFCQINFDAFGQIAAIAGQTWSGSFFFALVGGSLTNTTFHNLRVQELTSGGASVAVSDFNFNPTATLARVTGTRTFTGGTTAFARALYTFTTTLGVAIDLTLRIGWPQMELGAFATSPIRTTSAAATRATDVVTVTTLPVFGIGYSAFVKGTPNSPATNPANQLPLEVSDGSNNNRFFVSRVATTGGGRGSSASGGVTTSITLLDAWGQSGRIGMAVASADNAAALNGGGVLTAAPALPVGPFTTITLGKAAPNNWNGTVERVSLWPTLRLSNGDLRRITA